MYNDTRSATIATMPGCRNLRLRPALRLHLAGRENSRLTPADSRVADTPCFERRRALVKLRALRVAGASCQRDPTRLAFTCECPASWRTTTWGSSLFFAGGNGSRRETSEIWSSARSGRDDQARRTNLW